MQSRAQALSHGQSILQNTHFSERTAAAERCEVTASGLQFSQKCNVRYEHVSSTIASVSLRRIERLQRTVPPRLTALIRRQKARGLTRSTAATNIKLRG